MTFRYPTSGMVLGWNVRVTVNTNVRSITQKQWSQSVQTWYREWSWDILQVTCFWVETWKVIVRLNSNTAWVWTLWVPYRYIYVVACLEGWRLWPSAGDNASSFRGSDEVCSPISHRQRYPQVRDVCADTAAESRHWIQLQVRYLLRSLFDYGHWGTVVETSDLWLRGHRFESPPL